MRRGARDRPLSHNGEWSRGSPRSAPKASSVRNTSRGGPVSHHQCGPGWNGFENAASRAGSSVSGSTEIEMKTRVPAHARLEAPLQVGEHRRLHAAEARAAGVDEVDQRDAVLPDVAAQADLAPFTVDEQRVGYAGSLRRPATQGETRAQQAGLAQPVAA